VYSQFEPTDARRAFPCFDEPRFKTPWQLTLHVKQDQLAASNTPIESQTKESGGMKRVTFAATRPLPSYLVALVVGPFDVVDAGKAGRNKTPLRILVPKGRASEAAYAKSAMPELLRLLEDYFDSPFPYAKLDSAIMPVADFAMENAALITYGQATLLSRPSAETLDFQRECAVFLAHEMSHQWFGDLVTTSWWNDIWLNEAFATWMENKITGEWRPEWKMDVTEVRDRLNAMALDSLVSSRRVRQPVENDSDIANAFDGITYQKGAAVIEMIEHWIGEKPFQAGVRAYLRQYADQATTTGDFVAAVSKAAGRDLAPEFGSFLDQAGVPVVSILMHCDNGKVLLEATQSRFVAVGSPKASPASWNIPLCVAYSAGGKEQHECEVLDKPSQEWALKAQSCPTWILGNDGEIGYYRVQAPVELIRPLLADRAKSLSIAERVGALGDIGALVDTGAVPPAEALALIEPFGRDPDWRVVSETMRDTGIVRGDLVPAWLRPNAARFLRQMYGLRAHELGWSAKPGEEGDTRELRRRLSILVARDGEDPELLAEARKLALRWLDDHSSVDPGIADVILSAAASHGDQELFDKIHAAAVKSQDHHERQMLIAALGSFRDPAIIRQRLALLLTGQFDPRESFQQFLFPAPPEARTLPFEFVKQNLDALVKKLPRDVGEDYAAQLPAVGEAFCDASSRAELESFFGPRVGRFNGGTRILAQMLERIDLCIARKQALGPSLSQFLMMY
jgi:alanyl aminopeptidase